MPVGVRKTLVDIFWDELEVLREFLLILYGYKVISLCMVSDCLGQVGQQWLTMNWTCGNSWAISNVLRTSALIGISCKAAHQIPEPGRIQLEYDEVWV